ncbi:MAG: hypothetical protein ACREMQ_17385 [Longimicrobiales bacterium]
MTDADRSRITRECGVFTRYVVRADPTDYVVGKYMAAHERGHLPIDCAVAIDELLVRIARSQPAFAAIADAYAVLFRRGGALRRKLVVLTAILESCAPGFLAFESPPPARFAAVIARLAGRGAVFALLLVIATITIGPIHVGLRLAGRSRAVRRSAVVAPS